MKLKKNIAIFTFTWVIINSFSLYAQDDAGVLEVITPLDGTTLTVGSSYTVTVVIRNYGTTTLGNVPVQFSVGANTQLNEDVTHRAGIPDIIVLHPCIRNDQTGENSEKFLRIFF